MRVIDLNGAWQLCFAHQDELPQWNDASLPKDARPVPAHVPGNVELDLERAGVLPAPLEKGNNVYKTLDFEEHGWWYSREFEAPALAANEQAVLVFEGIDCHASIFVNGKFVGRCQNMLVAFEADATGALKAGRNTLLVRIDSAVLIGREAKLTPICAAFACGWESLGVRKAPHMYGWDILPRIVSAGIYRPARLEIRDRRVPQLTCYWATTGVSLGKDGAADRATVRVDWDADLPSGHPLHCKGWTVEVSLSQNGKDAVKFTNPVYGAHGRISFDVAEANLWWPRGWGKASLYDATLRLLDEKGAERAVSGCRLGLRTVELKRTNITDAEGHGEFVFIVNGQKLFVKGSNWVPVDALHSRDPQHYPVMMAMLTDINCNMVRCWGGNLYEGDAFFDACDENGILVWQDFAYACASYPDDPDSLEVYRTEAQAVVTRLRNHACLALWSGNNENDMGFYFGRSNSKTDPNLDKISREVLPAVIRDLDPGRPYLPSSPYVSPEIWACGDFSRAPEDHLWGPRDDFKGSYYRSSNAHFVSEIGYHGCPNRASLEAMFDPQFVWPWQDNDQWLTKSARPMPGVHDWDYRIPLMAKQIAVLFKDVPTELDDYILASQTSQAEALKFFLESWRMGKWRRTGMIWWNLRDGWPLLSDAIVDYYNRKKLAYYVMKQIQADVLIACGEPTDGRQEVVAVNDTLKAVSGTTTITDVDSGEQLFAGEFTIEANGKTTVGHVAEAKATSMRSITWTAGGVSGQSHYLAGPRPFDVATMRRWLPKVGLPVTAPEAK